MEEKLSVLLKELAAIETGYGDYSKDRPAWLDSQDVDTSLNAGFHCARDAEP